ncbi:uncharacterized protein BP5553_10372 [Venustampulla echinocandica]|uniref:MARVEL domain-containing protein n=1 Tax=Venustampulla echinocandica TaxID=2656787 RepID=A0A370TA03_9HELO|nr:uncharacterized protein BP5553_10372 [Venustampulla echinocandica]RDL30494.1 hypothetical protein BP5553_10372 [Venustampulla echinocandica]
MGAASKTCSVILRVCQLIAAAIVAGMLGRYLHFIATAHANAGSRIIYAEVIAGISIFVSIVLLPPLKYSFYCFALDFTLWLTVSGGCESHWYWNTWGYYWGRYWYTVPRVSITQSAIGTTGCSEWRTTLAFSFLGGWAWFISGILGIYVCTKASDMRSSDSEVGIVPRMTRRWRKPKNDAGHAKETTESAPQSVGIQEPH